MKITDFARKKQRAEKITMLTCYDYPSARIIAESRLDCVLVGDSVAMAVHGHESTVMASMDMMVLHTAAVARGITRQLIVADLPFLCHRLSMADTISNVRRLMQAGAQVIKMEGGDADTCHSIATLVNAGVPVIGHIGLTPQSICQLGGYTIQGKNEADAARLLHEAQALERAGCSALVIECVPQTVAQTITQALSIPTIGIGAGVATDGQVLVWHDMLGLQDDFQPRFLKTWAQGKRVLLTAIDAYVQHVQTAQFPAEEHAY